MKNTTKVLATAVFAASVMVQSFAVDAKVTSVTGKVQCQKKDSSEWVDLKKNDTLERGTIISTGFNSNATLNIDGSICTLAPMTRMSLEQLAQKDAGRDGATVTKTSVYIDTGKATFQVNSSSKKLNDFKVYSPASTASVRGTEFTAYASGVIETSSGMVAVSPAKTRSEVRAEMNNYFISAGKNLTAFSSPEAVGGGSVPVFAGQRASMDPTAGAGVSTDPQRQQKQDALATFGSTSAITPSERRVQENTSPFTFVSGAEKFQGSVRPGAVPGTDASKKPAEPENSNRIPTPGSNSNSNSNTSIDFSLN
jgi:hypothetical protein